MSLFIKKYSGFVSLLLIVGVFWSVFFVQAATLLFVSATMLFFLAVSIFFILERHKGTEDQRQKIVRDILVLVFTLVLIVLLGGFSGLWVSEQAGERFGAVVGLVCAVAVSFAMGYLVRKGVGKVFG